MKLKCRLICSFLTGCFLRLLMCFFFCNQRRSLSFLLLLFCLMVMMILNFSMVVLDFFMRSFTFPLTPSSDIEKCNHRNEHNQARIIMSFVVNMTRFKWQQLEANTEAIQHYVAHKEPHNHKHRCWYYWSDSLEHVGFVDRCIVELLSAWNQ